MDEDFLRQPAELRRGADWLKVGFAASKLSRPVVRPGSVRRLALIDRLRKSGSFPVMSVVAPAGYGKTTLLSQWAERNGQAFAWVSLDERDNDPKVLLTYVAEALDAVEPIGERVFDALASPGSSVPGSVVPRLGSALASMTSPVALVLDDVHVLHNPECRAAMPVLAGHVPDGSQLVLAGRDAPPLPIARLRAEGRVMEIGPGDLALTLAEASSLLREAGITLGQDDVAELHRRTEGWPAGLYLAALSLREGGSVRNSVASFTGEHQLVSRYMQSEFLARLSSGQRVFLTRTAVLGRMCGPLCEAVLDQPGAAATLADLARSNLLLVPLDAARGVVPLPPAVPRHAAGRAAPPGAGADPGPAAPRRRVVRAERPAGGGAGVLHRSRRRGRGRPPGGRSGGAGLPARPGHHAPAVVSVAGRAGRDRGTPDDRGDGLAAGRVDGAAGRCRAVGRYGRPLAVRGRGPARRPPRRGVGRRAPGHAVPARGRADAGRRRRGRAQVRRAQHRDAGSRGVAGDRAGPVR